MHKIKNSATLYYDSPLGILKLTANDNALISVTFAGKKGNDATKPSGYLSEVVLQLKEYFEGKRKTFDLHLDLQGTDFQKSVWQTLAKIPHGQKKSYKEVANLIGNENSSRAVGLACNKNRSEERRVGKEC